MRLARIIVLLGLTACGGVSLITIRKAPLPQKSRCGVERWSVKTLQDPGAAQVSFIPVSTSISYLRQFPAPKTLPNTRLTAERTTYTVSGTLIAWKQESDQDLHLVLSEGGRTTMIAEIPNPVCMGKSRVIRQVRVARAAVIQSLGKPDTMRFHTVNRKVSVTGVLFYDFLHGQRGVAPNGVELHPVTQVRFQ